MQNRLKTGTILLLILISLSAAGQKLVNSPLSRFNLGTIEPAGSFRSMGMGGIGTAMRDNTSIFITNPASYSSLDTNSFVFDFGIDYSLNKISEGGSKYQSDDFNFDHLIIGFPLSKGIGLVAGIVPLTNGYYKLSQTVKAGDPDYNPITGEYTATHSGEGGFTNFFIGSGIKLNKNFSAGINMSLVLGDINRLNQFIFADYENAYHNTSSERIQLTGMNFDYGLQYTAALNKSDFLTAGISLNSKKYYNTKYDNLTYRYTSFGNQDTLAHISDDSTKIFIPGTLRIGISAGRKNKFVVGIDYVTSKWSKARIPGAAGFLGDKQSILLGAEFIPEKYANYSYLRRVEYRIGGHLDKNYLVLDGKQIKEVGISAGFGLPMRRSLSKTNLFIDYTKKSGTISGLSHIENYFTMGISLNFYDFWFVKRKYD